MSKMSIHDAVKRFQKEWNEYEYSRLVDTLRAYESKVRPYGIVNFNDETLHSNMDGVESKVQELDFENMLRYQKVRLFRDKIKAYDNDPEPIKFKLETKKKYGDLYRGHPPESWENQEKDIIWKRWASVDLGWGDDDREGGLMKYGGYGRAEPKKYLRGHLYPETIIKQGWMPKKYDKTKVGKPYGDPLHGAKYKNGRLSDYGPEYYI